MNPQIFKAYDVRGLYPAELDEQIFHQIGRAFVAYLKAKRIGVGRDMRMSSPCLAAAFIAGAREQGADVIDYGMIATDMIYYAVATDDLDGGAQITASHNPKQYNGCKMVGRGNHPLSGDEGISDIRDMIAGNRIPAAAATPGRSFPADDSRRATSSTCSASSTLPSSNRSRSSSMPAAGWPDWRRPELFKTLPCTVDKLCFTIDGTFPTHEANPLIEENRRDIVARVKATRAEIGIAWDGDADRCFFIDEDGEFIPGDFVTRCWPRRSC
jgi:phosphomannomutase